MIDVHDTINSVVSKSQLILLTIGITLLHNVRVILRKMVTFVCYKFNDLSWSQKIDTTTIITICYITSRAFETDKELARFW